MADEAAEAKKKIRSAIQAGGETSPGELTGISSFDSSWLGMIFPSAAAREEQIRQAAQGGNLSSEPAGAAENYGKRPANTIEGAEALLGRGMPHYAPTARESDASSIRKHLAGMPQNKEPFPKATTPMQRERIGPTQDRDAPRATVSGPPPLARPQSHDDGGGWWMHQVLDPLVRAADAQDWQQFEQTIARQMAIVAGATPTVAAVEGHKRTLLALGQQSRAFQASVERATDRFLAERPMRAAADVEGALQSRGAGAAAMALRVQMDPETTDPLTAGRIFALCESSIHVVAAHLTTAAHPDRSHERGRNDRQDARKGPGSPFHLGQTFCDLNAACDSASRDMEGLQVTRRLAERLRNAPVDMVVTASIRNGEGVALPLELVRTRVENGQLRDANALAFFIEVGVQELRQKTRGAVLELEDTASVLTEQVAKRGKPPPGNDERTTHTLRSAYPNLVNDLDAQLAALNRYSYTFMRAVRSLDEAGSWLEDVANHDALRNLGVPSPEDFPTLSFALRTMPASVAEARRLYGPELTAAEACNGAHSSPWDPSLNMEWFHDFRHFLDAPYPVGR
jgi:hypothetical protein